MGTFKAVRIDKAEKGTTAALAQFDERIALLRQAQADIRLGALHTLGLDRIAGVEVQCLVEKPGRNRRFGSDLDRAEAIERAREAR